MNETSQRSLRIALPRLAGVLLGLSCTWLSFSAVAGVYKWVGPDGVTVYSQLPPPGTQATELREAPPPSPEDTQRADQRVRAQVEQDFDQKLDAERAAEEAGQQSSEQALRRNNCAAARKNLETIENLGARMVRTPDGEYLRLSEPEREARITEARQQIEQNCD